MSAQVRTRFAPSPTGYLHIGGVRTALFSWLYAKKHGGEFVLRVEDTDKERSSADATKAIVDGMHWLGLDADEGPIFQSDRDAVYREKVQQLLDEDKAYRCYCPKERLDELREQQMQTGLKPKYDGHCRHSTEQHCDDEEFVVRFKTPEQGSVDIDDLVHGKIVINQKELDDLIIARTDGSPTYNFTVVVDDIEMRITHVIRGDDHINNTPRQINIYHAFGAPLPLFAHVPMINGSDGKKLSKRHGAVSVLEYKDKGYTPQALLNYLLRLGWSHGDQEIFSLDEMITLFDLEHINKSSSTFSDEKLDWISQHYIRDASLVQNVPGFVYCLDQRQINYTQGPSLERVIEAYADKAKNFADMAYQTGYLFSNQFSYDREMVDKHCDEDSAKTLVDVMALLKSNWGDAPALALSIKEFVKSTGLKFPKVAQPLRIALTGSTQSPSIDIVLDLLGANESLARIEKFKDYLLQKSA